MEIKGIKATIVEKVNISGSFRKHLRENVLQLYIKRNQGGSAHARSN